MRKITAQFLIVMILLAATLASTVAYAAATPVRNTRHNLSTTGTGSIKTSSTENQICVFCHTPHSTRATTQLWNHPDTTATITMYSSDYTTSIGLTTPASPKARTKLCLSCHDGTVALGSQYNLSGSGGNAGGTLAMQKTGVGAITTLPAGTSNLGTTLANDHPVGYAYDPTKDTQLNAVGTIAPLKLDPSTTPSTVECATCHNPHDNQFTFFLRQADNTALCTKCHNKTGWASASHGTSTTTITGTSATNYVSNYATVTWGGATTVGAVGCRICHQTHNSGGAPYITKFVEEATCFNGTSTSCHGTSATVVANRIQPELAKVRRHPTIQASKAYAGDPTVYGTHKDVSGGESALQLGDTGAVNRHAECPDCHNPHQAQPTSPRANRATSGSIGISKALIGTWGVYPTTWPTPPTAAAMTNNDQFLAASLAPAGYTRIATPLDEYQVCLKCHSSYVTLNGRRDIATEINPGYPSYHGIVPGGTSNTFVNTTTANEPWASASAAVRQRVWCSDCHGSETDASAMGPHGSNTAGVGPIAGYVRPDGFTNLDKMLRRTIQSDSTNGTPLCLLCHRTESYWAGGTGGTNMNRHAASREKTDTGCFTCHMWQYAGTTAATGGKSGKINAHGMNNKWAYNESVTTLTAGNGQLNQKFIGGFQTNTNFTAKQCTTDNNIGAFNGGCGGNHTNASY